MTYKPQTPPVDVKSLPGYLAQEVLRIAEHLSYWDLEENPRFEALVLPAQSMKPGASAIPDFGALTAGLQTYLFDSTAQESLYFATTLPRGYREGSAITPYVNWCSTTTSSGSVKFEVIYSWANVGSAMAASTLTAADTITASYTPKASSLGSISGAGRQIGSVLIGRLSRLSSDVSDTYSYDVGVFALEFRYQRDADGSRRETIK